jgi:hypothetical protein
MMFSNARFGAGVAAFALALTCVTAGNTAIARNAHDGNWSVLIAGRGGACSNSYRYGVRISDGLIIYDGGIVAMQGRVALSGAVRVRVQSGNQWATGSGRLTKSRGSGVWTGQGASGTCAGTWVAERR